MRRIETGTGTAIPSHASRPRCRERIARSAVAAASTVQKQVAEGLKFTGNVEAAKAVGKAIAERAKAKGVTRVAFDRSGFKYHGRVKALADAARENGLEF